jgi:hypothetical protein
MASKSLNHSLDSHFTKVKSGIASFKPKKEARSLWKKIKALFKKCKNYLLPPPEFETTYIDNSGTTVVTRKPTGILAHLDIFKIKLHHRKQEKIKKKQGPESIDMSKVEEVMNSGKLKK